MQITPKYGRHAVREIPDMTPEKKFSKMGVVRVA